MVGRRTGTTGFRTALRPPAYPRSMTTPARSFLAELAAALGTVPPTDAEMDDLLSLASAAAHASERVAAPVACWMVARAGRSPAEALAVANQLAGRLGGAAAAAEGTPGGSGASADAPGHEERREEP